MREGFDLDEKQVMDRVALLSEHVGEVMSSLVAAIEREDEAKAIELVNRISTLVGRIALRAFSLEQAVIHIADGHPAILNMIADVIEKTKLPTEEAPDA